MARSIFDLSKFKKAREDRGTALLIHPDGHQIQIDKTSLDPRLLKQLSALPMQPEQKFSDGGQVSPDQQISQMMAPEPEAATPVVPDEPQGPSAPRSIKPSKMTPMLSGPNLGTPAASSQAPQLGQPDPYGQYMKDVEGGLNTQAAGRQDEADATSDLGKEQAKYEANHQSMLLQVHADHQDQYDALNQEIGHTIDDINKGHIDPKHYVNSMSTGSKVATAIGLILGGIGSAGSGQPNAAMTFLQKNIENDVAAQRANLGVKETVLGGFLKQMGNLNDATKMTQAFYNELTASKMLQLGAEAKSPMAQAAAKTMAGQFKVQAAQILGPLAMQRAMWQQMNNPNIDAGTKIRLYGMTGMMNPSQQEQAFKELQAAENHSTQSSVIMDAFDAANKTNTIGNRVGHAGYNPAAVAQLQTAMMPYLKDAEGRINEQELERTDALIPRPLDGPAKIQAKRVGLQNFLAEKGARPMLKAYGISAPQGHAAPAPNPNVLPGYGN